MIKLIFFSFTLLTSLNLWAGDKVGNGGGLWTCSQGHNLTRGILVDLYEAQEEFGLNLISSFENDPMQIVQERSNFVRMNLTEYSVQWNRILSESFKKIRLVNSELIIVEDSLFRIKPSAASCSNDWVYTQFANYTAMDQILIRQDLWNSPAIPTTHKAALIWHEVIYKWLREQYGDQNSIRARQIVGYLFSTTLPSEMRIRIQNILSNSSAPQPPQTPPAPVPPVQPKKWICMVSNSHNSTFYGNYGANQQEARVKTIQACKSGENGFFCNDHEVQCEEILQSENSFTCENKNTQLDQIYLGQGRNRLEAEYKSREACQKTNQKFFCDREVKCE